MTAVVPARSTRPAAWPMLRSLAARTVTVPTVMPLIV
jgi:hypothetical protein